MTASLTMFRQSHPDPAQEFERREQMTCKGCTWIQHENGVQWCGNSDHRLGNRCIDYTEKKSHAG